MSKTHPFGNPTKKSFDPFDRKAGLKLTVVDAGLLNGIPAPLKILVPVKIEDDEECYSVCKNCDKRFPDCWCNNPGWLD
jgi:hypothetical protein